MGRWSYSWLVEFYLGQWLERKYIDAKSKAEAINKVRQMVPGITEIHCCIRARTW